MSVESQFQQPNRILIPFYHLRRQHIKELQDAVTAVEDCTKPVVAAVHGICYGAGIDIMAACDIRYAAKGTRFSIKVRRHPLSLFQDFHGRFCDSE